MKIDGEFQAMIPPLTDEEFEGLEQDILRDGCRDALVVWRGTLLDGHNRHAICTEHGIGFRTVEMDFPDKAAAKDWIDANQLHRRNLTPDQARLIRGRRYNRTKGKHGGARASGQSDHLKTAEKIAAASGVSEATVRRDAKAVSDLAPEDEQAIIAGEKTFTQVKREKKEAKRQARRDANAEKAKDVSDPVIEDVKFATIVIDPPWDWGDEGDVDQMGRAKPDYATMSIDKLMDLPVFRLSDDDCHLYLWATNRSLPKAFRLVEKWNFRYITTLTWPKTSFGMGNYFRGQTEQVVFAVRGSQPLKRKDASTLLPAWKRGPDGHSSKPPEFLEFVESVSPGPYIEMFSRGQREGWEAWGADAI